MSTELQRRRVSNRDTSIAIDSLIATGTVGTMLVAWLNHAPTPADVTSFEAALAAQLTGVFLVHQKARLVSFITQTVHKVRQLPSDMQQRFQTNAQSESGERILETVWHQAAQAVDPEVLNMISSLLKNSLASDELEERHTRWLLGLLDKIDPVQVVILQLHTQRHKDDKAFKEQHKVIVADAKPPELERVWHPHYGQDPASEEERAIWLQDYKEWEEQQKIRRKNYEIHRERHALYLSRVHHLVELGLIGAKSEKDKVSFGDIILGDIESALTPLGAALLKIVDAANDDEWGQGEQMNPLEALQAAKESIIAYAQGSQEIAERYSR